MKIKDKPQPSIKLSILEVLQHYAIALFTFGIALLTAITGNDLNTNIPTLFFCVVTVIVFLLKRNQLNFKIIKGFVTADKFEQTIARCQKDLEWIKLFQDKKNIYQFQTKYNLWRVTKTITIIYQDDRIFFNALPIPDLGRNGESFIPNRKSLKTFLRHLNEVRKNKVYSPTPDINSTQWNTKMVLARLFIYPLFTSVLVLFISEGVFSFEVIIGLGLFLVFTITDLYMIFFRKKT